MPRDASLSDRYTCDSVMIFAVPGAACKAVVILGRIDGMNNFVGLEAMQSIHCKHPSERLASLGIMPSQLRLPLEPLHTLVLRCSRVAGVPRNR